MNLKEWAKYLNFNYQYLRNLIYNRKIELYDIVNNPQKFKNIYPNNISITQLSQNVGISRSVVTKLLKKYTVDEIIKNGRNLLKIKNINKKFTYKNQTLSIREFAEKYNIKYITLRTRIY